MWETIFWMRKVSWVIGHLTGIKNNYDWAAVSNWMHRVLDYRCGKYP